MACKNKFIGIWCLCFDFLVYKLDLQFTNTYSLPELNLSFPLTRAVCSAQCALLCNKIPLYTVLTFIGYDILFLFRPYEFPSAPSIVNTWESTHTDEKKLLTCLNK